MKLLPIVGALLLSTAPVQAQQNVMSCEAFARPSGMNMRKDLPCRDGTIEYKSFLGYCDAMLNQNDIRRLSGCPSQYFDRFKN